MSKAKKIVLIVLAVLLAPWILLAIITVGYLHTTGISDFIIGGYTLTTAETSSQYERGIWFLENGLEKSPTNRYLATIVAINHSFNFEYDSSHAVIDRALEDRSDSNRVSFLLHSKGLHYGVDYQFDSALVYFDDSWAHDSTLPNALLFSARTHIIDSNDYSAMEYMKKAYNLFPESPDIAEEIALIYEWFGENEHANKWIDRAILSPQAMNSTEMLKISLLISDSLYSDAEARLNELSPGIFTPAAELNKLRAELAVGTSDLQSAKTITEQLCEMMPTSIESWLSLYTITRDLGDTSEALEFLDKAYTLEPRNHATLFYLASNSALDGDTASALDLLQTAVNNGYLNLTAIESEEDLASIRETEQFQNIVIELNGRIEKWISFTENIDNDDLPQTSRRSKKVKS